MKPEVDDKLEDLYELILKHCNSEPVKNLLRKYKRDEDLSKEKRDDVRISAENYRQIVLENLKTAVERKVIPINDVFGLLQEAEENGSQHIFFYRPKSNAARSSLTKPEAIADGLLGSGWASKFPQLRLQPEGYRWSDFRLLQDGGWLAKMYGHSTKDEQTDEKSEGSGRDRVRWVKIETKDVRVVCVARWLADSELFELRVADTAPKELHEALKRQLRSVVDVDKLCNPWELGPIRHRLFSESKQNSDLYECGNWSATDKESYVLSGGPHIQDSDEPVHVADVTRKLISQVAANKDLDKRKLVLHWKPTEANGNKRKFRTILGTTANTHEMIVTAQATSKAIDDVVYQLLNFES